MFDTLPARAEPFLDWPWPDIEPYFQDLLERPLDASNVHAWLADWTRLSDLMIERHARLTLAVNLETTDKDAEARYDAYLDSVYPGSQAANQRLKQKLLASGLQPDNFAAPLRKMRAEAALFRQSNLPLLTEEHKLTAQYNKIIGAQSVSWQGQELTLQQMRRALQTPDRAARKHIWQIAAERQLADRAALNQLWSQYLDLRCKLAANADFPDYRAFRWQQMLRLDYTPQDCLKFQKAIEQVAVPAATRMYEKYRQRLGVERLRPWDLDQDLYPLDLPPLPPYGSVSDLQDKVQGIFTRLDPQLGRYFQEMRAHGMLDLDNRKGKAPGAYCTAFPSTRRPFIFMNAVGLASDVRTILHESGHAFHNFERLQLPYTQQRLPGLEFSEVASMAMELLADPYVSREQGGFYDEAQARRFRLAHLEHLLAFWPYMAVVDAFQHWAYSRPDLSNSPRYCDAKWFELWQRFMPGVDWSGLDAEAMTGWQRKQHIFRYPFYYVEYGLAQLGAVQVWHNARQNPRRALKQYRRALGLGGTASLPELYKAAGARFAFDARTLAQAVQFIETAIATQSCA
ncbi:MAG: M3 family oligoendopeptidase [Chloroflexota bacterium]